MRRVDFLKKGAAVASGTIFSVFGVASSSALTSCGGPKEKIIGLQLYSLREEMAYDVPGTLKAVADMGYKTLETAGYADGKLYGYAPEEFRKMCEDLGMKVHCAHLGKPYDAEKVDEVMQWWDLALDTQVKAGCTHAVMPSFPIGEKLEDIKTYCDYFNKIGELANKKGLKFGFHNHAGEFAERDGEVILDYMIANTDPEKVFYELDVYWTEKGGVNPAEYIKKHKGRIPILHIKDESIIGEGGVLDFKAIFDAAYECGMEEYFVEVERYTMPSEICVQRSFDYLNVADFTK